jgi:subtilisin
MGDRDGKPGGLGGEFQCLPGEFDDSPASFSNFATLAQDQTHTVAAPGVCVPSTWIGGIYAVWNGTSFSAPMAAGTVACA